MTCGVAPVQVTATSLSGSGLVACRAPPESGEGLGVVSCSSSTCAGVAAAVGSRAGSTSSVWAGGGAMPIDGAAIAADAGTPVATSTAASGATSPAPTQRPAVRVLRPTIPPIGRPQGERAGGSGDTGTADQPPDSAIALIFCSVARMFARLVRPRAQPAIVQ